MIHSGSPRKTLSRMSGYSAANIDPNFGNVVSLIQMKDISYTDVIPAVTWANQSSVISTTNPKFNGTSMYTNNSTGSIRTTSSGPRAIGNNAFTWQGWMNVNTFPANGVNWYGIFTLGDDSSASNRVIQAQYINDGSINIYGTAVLAGATPTTGNGLRSTTGIVTLGGWLFIEVNATALSGGNRTFRIFVQGNKVVEVTVSSGSFNSIGYTIGRSYFTAVLASDAYFSECELTNGVVRNTSNYTPPTQPFPTQ